MPTTFLAVLALVGLAKQRQIYDITKFERSLSLTFLWQFSANVNVALQRLIGIRFINVCIQGILKGKYHCTVDLLFDWFGISCMTTDHFCFYLPNSLIQTSQTGGQRYSDTSPFSIPWCIKPRSAYVNSVSPSLSLSLPRSLARSLALFVYRSLSSSLSPSL